MDYFIIMLRKHHWEISLNSYEVNGTDFLKVQFCNEKYFVGE